MMRVPVQFRKRTETHRLSLPVVAGDEEASHPLLQNFPLKAQNMDLSGWDGVSMDNSEDARCLGHLKHYENVISDTAALLPLEIFCFVLQL